MRHRRIVRFNVVFGTVDTEFVAIKLESAVHHEGMGDTEPRGDVLVYERLYVTLCDR